ncbi:MAG TPA: cyclic nucleotide-binding domain-containing protein [Planctomycetaceae bacterium]|nr:cyclic nucleotide-binding domain-containing protein [Planctomycetaceae bacterium]
MEPMLLTARDASLNGCPILRGMTEDERRQVVELLDRHTFHPGEVILQEGRAVQILWIIVRGRCEVVKTMQHGGEQRLAVLEPGAIFGEISFFSPAPHSASVRALSEVEVMLLPRAEYDRVERAGSSVAYKIVLNAGKVLAERLRRMDEWTCELIDSPDVANHRDEWREFQSKLYSEWDF